MDLSKYFKGEYVVINRSVCQFADYNPRTMTPEEKKTLKNGIKRYGLLGGLVVNKQTGNTICGGHQRITCMDELQKYDPETKANDYSMRVELIDVDLKTEQEIVVLLNNPNAQGKWDDDKLRRLVGSNDFDWKNVGLTNADLSMIGVDFTLQTKEEQNLANELDDMMSDLNEEHRQEVEQRKQEREAQRAMEKQMVKESLEVDAEDPIHDAEARKAHMQEVKQQVKEKAMKTAEDMDAYLMLSFDNYENKAAFCEKFGYDPNMKFVKGEEFDERQQFIYED